MTNGLLPKNWVFLSTIKWSPSPSTLEGPHEVILGDFAFAMEEATCPLSFFCFCFFSSKSIMSSCAQPPPCPKEKNPHPDWASYVRDIGSYIWLLHSSNTWTRLPKQVIPTYQKIIHAWNMRFLYVILTYMVVGTALHE